MKTATLSLPGKTFLAGEYLALLGGASFVICTQPRFQLVVTPGAGDQPFHPQSPAGKLWSKYSDVFQAFQFQFLDPYQGRGGFGASSAQFGLLHAFLQLREKVFSMEELETSQADLDWHQTVKEYRALAQEEKSLPPSGADLAGVFIGGIAFFDRNAGHAQKWAWPFSDLQFSLFHTGRKLATHEHLRELKIFETQNFQAASVQILKGLSLLQKDSFLSGVRAYRDELFRQGKVTNETREIVARFEALPNVFAAKGCGAMGSDVILVLHDQQEKALQALANQWGLQKIADEKDLAVGFEIHQGNFAEPPGSGKLIAVRAKGLKTEYNWEQKTNQTLDPVIDLATDPKMRS